MPTKNPKAALEPVSETAAQTSITNDSCLVFMSLAAIANSIPANNKSTPRIPIGNSPKILPREFPNTKASTSFAIPRKTTEAPLLPPNLYCPAKPPAPWQQGMAPNQHPTKFISPTLTETCIAEASRSGNKSPDSLQTAITEFKTDNGIWGIAALTNPTLKSSQVILTTEIFEGPNLRSPKIEGSRIKHNTKPNKNTINAAGIVDKTLNLRRTLTLFSFSSSSSCCGGGGSSPAPVVRTRKSTATRAMATPSRANQGRGGPDFDLARSWS